ncbi:hypothetical protein [Enterococcus faecium]|uniref:hypothetical protein n=1 Tax=Enterococcus faecium TaxID=1352 RepID=UPI000BF1FAB8|nr:hypothetical protein [Enterococcus faecium]PEH49302.1 hypothetical protein CRM75_16115 [Enterococcus faecium]
MRYILCQPAIARFKWELEVCLTNLKKLGIKDIVLLFSKNDSSIPRFFKEKYDVEIHVYEDRRDKKEYLPSIKPYLWWKYLEENPERENERYVYIDSDVIFKEKINLRKMPSKNDVWYCSDCNGYLNLDYIRQCENGEQILKGMAKIVGVTIESLETINHNSGGAQWVIKNPKAAYWEKVYFDSNRLYEYFKGQKTNLQKWTAEMWAQLWNMMYFNIGPKVHPELSFCWPTNPVEEWKKVKILHNAGVTGENGELFFKGKYVETEPFNEDFSFVNPEKASIKYVEAIQQVSI